MDYQNQIVREDMCELAKEHLPFEKLKGSSVLVTGASGMLATYIVYFFIFNFFAISRLYIFLCILMRQESMI